MSKTTLRYYRRLIVKVYIYKTKCFALVINPIKSSKKITNERPLQALKAIIRNALGGEINFCSVSVANLR